MSGVEFHPWPALRKGVAHPACRAVVILPARNEEASLPATLDALAAQVDAQGRPLARDSFEVLLLLNNCTDDSANVCRRWGAAHPGVALHVVERTLEGEEAHVGTARRLLMDTAWHRLSALGAGPARGILSTDSDTVVAPDWIARNLEALEGGADAVGGVIRLRDEEFAALPDGARRAYERDRQYQQLVAELEDLLDPQPGDPWPRHLEHFGASLACTPAAYARAGGLPPVKPLEDVAFVDALRRVDARLRHEPGVVVYTSSRMEGRAEIGLSHQLGLWQRMSEEGTEHCVPSAAWLIHRFRTLRGLRRLCEGSRRPNVANYPAAWRERIAAAYGMRSSVAEFLAAIDCDELIESTFRGEREGPIGQVNRQIAAAIERMRGSAAPLQNIQPVPVAAHLVNHLPLG